MGRYLRVSHVRLIVFTILAVMLLALTAFQFKKEDRKSYHFGESDGTDWYQQPDMLAFKSLANADIPDAKEQNAVKKIERKTTSDGNVVQLYLKEESSDQKRKVARQFLEETKNAFRLPVLTTAPNMSAEQEKWVIAENRLLVQLEEQDNQNNTLKRLANNYNLQIVRQGEIVHVLKILGMTKKQRSIFKVANKLQENEQVKRAYPNRLEMFEAHGGDPKLDQAWHVSNKGKKIWCADKSGTEGADISVDHVWQQGYYGQGVKVGVIDFFGFDYDHPDMQGRMAAGYNCIDNSNYDASNFFFTDESNAHAMTVSGIIAAEKNNGIGSAGVAPEATVVPFLIDNSEASIILALEKAISSQFDVDVINMSFGASNATSLLHDAIKEAVENGRDDKGTVLVASHGNDNKDDQNSPQYPSAFKEVISVGASTPEDKLKKPSDGWDVTGEWGSNYGDLLDVVAPGVCIVSTDLTGSKGYHEDGDFVGLSRTSASAPLVSGTAALLLEKNPDLTWQGVREKIRNGADQIGDYSYNKQNDKSRETGYGRINAASTLGVAVGIAESSQSTNAPSFNLTSPVSRNMTVFVKGRIDEPLTMTVYNVAGQQKMQRTLQTGSNKQQFNVDQLAKGIYMTSFRNSSGEVLTTQKFVKSQ